MAKPRDRDLLADTRPRLRLPQPVFVDLDAEAAYWRACCRRGLFDTGTLGWIDYAPAFRLGVETYLRVPEGRAALVEPLMRAAWNRLYGRHGLPWRMARRACLAAWSDLVVGHWSDEPELGVSDVTQETPAGEHAPPGSAPSDTWDARR